MELCLLLPGSHLQPNKILQKKRTFLSLIAVFFPVYDTGVMG